MMKERTSVHAYIAKLTAIQQELAGTPDEIANESLISHLMQNLEHPIHHTSWVKYKHCWYCCRRIGF